MNATNGGKRTEMCNLEMIELSLFPAIYWSSENAVSKVLTQCSIIKHTSENLSCPKCYIPPLPVILQIN